MRVFLMVLALPFGVALLTAGLVGLAVRLTDWIENRRDLRAVTALRDRG